MREHYQSLALVEHHLIAIALTCRPGFMIFEKRDGKIVYDIGKEMTRKATLNTICGMVITGVVLHQE